MKLTAGKDRERIKRYSHVKRARGWGVEVCSAMCPGTAYACSREKGHRGAHVSHGWLGRVVAVWDAGVGPHASPERMRSALRARQGGDLRTRSPEGSLSRILSGLGRLFSSVDHIAFLILLLAFIGFAIQWILMVRG